MSAPKIHTDIVNQILKGRKNFDMCENRRLQKPKRLAITDKILILLKELIRTWDTNISQKLLIWAVCTLAFAGSFRIHELLCRQVGVFDPDFDLLTQDVTLMAPDSGRRFLSVTLKSPKENKDGQKTVVDVFESEGVFCPVKAFDRWFAKAGPDPEMPLFRDGSGHQLTGNKFNSILKMLLEPHVDYKKGKFTSHSFRAGVATMLARKGFDDEAIKEAGRWHGPAFERYIKTPRTKRAVLAKIVADF